MAVSNSVLIAEAIEDNLDHLHKQRWETIAAELHDAEHKASDDDRERIRQALRDHYANRFRPETSRQALVDQALDDQVRAQTA